MAARKKLNVRFALVLTLGTAAFAGAVHLLHRYQVARGARDLLDESVRLEQAGELAEAAEDLDRYLLLNRDDADARARFALLIGRMSKTRKQKERAYLAMADAIVLSPGRTDLLRAMAPLAAQLDLKREAREHLAALRQAGVEDADLMRQQARIEVAEQKTDKAEEWYRKAIKAAPADPGASLELAAFLREQRRDPDRANREIDRLLRDGGSAAPVRLVAARYYLQCGDPAKAERTIVTADGDAKDDDPDVLLLAAEVALAQNKTDAARRHLDRGAGRFPRDSRFPCELARLELRVGNREKALALVGPHAAAANQPPEEIWRIGNLLIDVGDMGRAEELIGRLGPNVSSWAPDHLRGRLLMRKEAWAEARQSFERAVAGRNAPPPELARHIYLMLAECHERLANPDGQVAAYGKILEIDPQWHPARHLLAAAHLAAGRPNEAIREYRVLVTKSADVRVELARLLIPQVLLLPPAERRWTEIEQLLDGVPDAQRGKAQLLRAEMLFVQGRPGDARWTAETERDRDPKQPGPWLLLVGLAERGPDPDAAAKVIDEAERQTGPRTEWAVARIRRAVLADRPNAVAKLNAVEATLVKLPDADRLRVVPVLADAYSSAGSVTEAGRVWGKLADAKPNDPEPRFRLFGLAADRGDEAQARAWAADLARIEGAVAPMAAFAEAVLHTQRVRQGDRTGIVPARQAIARAVAARGAWPPVILLDAELCEQDGDKLRAIEKYESVVAAGRCPAPMVRRLVQLLAEQGRYADARTVLAKLPNQTSDGATHARADAQLVILGATGRDAAQVRRQGFEAARKAVDAGSTDYRDHLWLGEMALLADERVAAERAFRQARDLKDSAPEPWIALVLLLARTNPKAAQAELEAARGKLAPDLLPQVLAVGYEVVGRTKEAGDHYRAMAAARPNEPAVLRNLALFQLRSGDTAEAEKTLRKVLELGPKLPPSTAGWARRTLAVALVSRPGPDRVREAGALVEPATTGPDPTDDDRWTRAIVLAAQPGRRKEAIDILEKLTVPATVLPDAHFLLAQLYDRDGRWPMARIELANLLRADDRNPIYLTYYAAALLRNGQPAEAEEWVRKLAGVTGETFATVELRASGLKARGKPDDAAKLVKDFAAAKGAAATQASAAVLDTLDLTEDAERMYRKFVGESREPTAPLVLAGFLARRGKLPEALTIYEAAWKTCPAGAVARDCILALRAGKGTREDAKRVEAWLDAAVAADPRSVGLLLLRGDLYQFQERFAEAATVYREILRADPRQVVALNNLAFLLAVKDGRTDEGLTLIDAGLAITGPHPELLDTRGVVLTRAGRTDDAAADLRRAIADAPSGDKQFHLAMAQLKAGRRADAANDYHNAVRIGLKREDLHPLERPDCDRLAREFGGR